MMPAKGKVPPAERNGTQNTKEDAMNTRIESLIHNARQGWASGALASDADFQFVEDLWIIYHLGEALNNDQVVRLEQINSYLAKGVPSGGFGTPLP